LRQKEAGHTPENYSVFADLVHKMLIYDPSQRILPQDALNHPFITEGGGDVPTSASSSNNADSRNRRSRSAPSAGGGRGNGDEKSSMEDEEKG